MRYKTTIVVLAALAAPATVLGQSGGTVPQTTPGRLTLYNQTNYNGEDMEIDGQRRTLRWDYHPRSIAIHRGDRWEVCARPRYQECIILNRSVADSEAIGIPAGRDIGSIRPADDAVRAATPNMAPAQPQRQPGM